MINIIKYYLLIVRLLGPFLSAKVKAPNSEVIVTSKANDIRLPFYLRFPSTDIGIFRQVFIDQEYNFFMKIDPEVIIDAGANIGLFSIYMANKYKNAKIISIEPEKSNFDQLKRNVAPYGNIIPVQAALWHQIEEITLVDPGRGKHGFITTEEYFAKNPIGSFCHKVAGITIDKLISDYGLDRIDILKVDIEGAEKEVFSDTSSWITNVDALIVELHERFKPGCDQSFKSGARGFNYEWCHGENEYLSRGNCLPLDKTLFRCTESRKCNPRDRA